MKKGEHYLTTIERVDFPNKGIAHVDDMVCEIKNVLPGQEVEFAVSKKRGGRVEGRLINVVKPASNEIDSPCPHFGTCGGCTYMNLAYEDQLKMKEEQIRAMLTQALSKQEEDWSFLPIKASPLTYEYRNKMEFCFGDEYLGGPLALGMHKRGSFYDVETVSECKLVDEDYRKILVYTRDFFKEYPFYHKMKHEGLLRHLLVRKAVKTGDIMVALVTSSLINIDSEVSAWKDGLLNLNLSKGSFKGILHIINDSVADVVKADEMKILYGTDSIKEELLGLKFNISTFSFFQTNTLGAEVLYETVREFIGDIRSDNPNGPVVFDLYSGTGTITQMMAPVSSKIYGVEIVEEAVIKARENAKINGLTNCVFIADDVLKALDNIEEKPDFIILDPPRDGVHPKALNKILAYGVERLIYIACKPTSLCRDIESFLLSGYHVEKAVCVDMFPNTQHVETVVLLSQLRNKPDDYIDVDVDIAELEGTSAETKATYEKIKKYVAEHNNGMKVSSLNIAQVKRKCGLELAENFNLPKSENARQPQCPKEKEEAIMKALKVFQMI